MQSLGGPPRDLSSKRVPSHVRVGRVVCLARGQARRVVAGVDHEAGADCQLGRVVGLHEIGMVARPQDTALFDAGASDVADVLARDGRGAVAAINAPMTIRKIMQPRPIPARSADPHQADAEERRWTRCRACRPREQELPPRRHRPPG